MTMGPVSYTVVAFPGNQFNGNIAPEVEKLVASGIVRILDLVFVGKDDAGDTMSLEFDQLDELAAFGELEGEVGGLINMEDLDHVAAGLPRRQLRPDHRLGGRLGPAARRGRDRGRAGWSSTAPASRPPWSRPPWPSWLRRSPTEACPHLVPQQPEKKPETEGSTQCH